jgi:hypothetical protein
MGTDSGSSRSEWSDRSGAIKAAKTAGSCDRKDAGVLTAAHGCGRQSAREESAASADRGLPRAGARTCAETKEGTSLLESE